jgi:5-methylcytosine-specific restriction endonuclease McrA
VEPELRRRWERSRGRNVGGLASSGMWAVDHVKPITKGGSHMPANLRPICGPCNSLKHNTWPYP